MDKTLWEAVQILNKFFHSVPILYGSFAVEKVLQRDFDAHDIDLLVEHAVLEKKSDLLERFTLAGFRFLHEDPLSFRKGGIDVELADREKWFETCRFASPGESVKDDSDHMYVVLNVDDLLRLYRYLLQDPFRPEVKKQRDRFKIDLLGKLVEKGENSADGVF